MRSLLLLFSLAVTSFAANGPWNLDHLNSPPKAEWGAKEGLTQEVWYESEPFQGKLANASCALGPG
ncbi:MAG: hypothetical protein ABI680_11595, partial [Chthoniobacteraceae bacterium]